jgi:hypothetical protein
LEVLVTRRLPSSPVVLLVLLASAAAASEPSSWMPVEVGTKKTFVHRQDRTLESGGESLGDERWVGTREDRVLPLPGGSGPAAAELRITTRVNGEGGEEVETQRLFVSPTPSAYRIHSARLDADGRQVAIDYATPATVLAEDAKVGETWHVSSENVGDLKGETWGEVVGIQDARTPAGLFEDCLVVRYTVDISGTFEIPGAGAMDVAEGRMVVTEWHARGVGMVLAKETLSETLIGPNGVEVLAGMTSQTALKRLELAEPPPAAAGAADRADPRSDE